MSFIAIVMPGLFDRKYGRLSLLALFTFAVLIGIYALLIEPRRLRVVEYDIATPKWPYDDGLTIALIADPHLIWPWTTPDDLARVVRRVNALDADLVLLLGDYVGTHPFGVQISPATGVAPLRDLRARCGVYAVLGNHDFDPKDTGWPEALAATDIPVLQNQALRIRCQAGEFWIAGLAELWKQHADIAQTMQTITDDKPVIMMTHNPDAFAQMPDRVALSVAGHTHGGQVRIPFFGAVPWVIPSRYGLRYAYGHIIEEGKDLVVTGGLGMTGLPIRFLMPPEITVIHLSRKPAG
jgi:predicted MPP superfamily phosphohydrolase